MLVSLYKRASQHFGFKKYLKNTGWVFLGKFGSTAVSLLATLFIARELGPANFGELSYAISFVALFSFIASFGIDSVLYRDLVKYPEKRNELIGSALLIKICASLAATGIAVGSAFFLSPKDVSFVLVIIISSSFLFQSFNIITTEFGAIVQNKGISTLSIIVSLILNALKIVVITYGGGVIYLALILLLESILYASGFIYLHTKTFGKFTDITFTSHSIKQLIFESWPFIFSGGFAVIYSRIDQVMLKNLIDATSVGLYDSAVRLSELWYFIPTIIAGSLFPAIINAKTHSQSVYKKRVFYLLAMLVGIALFVTILISFFAPLIISIVFGESFINAVPVLKIYILAFIPTTIIIVANQVLLAERSRFILFASTLLGMVCNIIANAILIPMYQTTGAAAATVLSSSAVVVFLFSTYIYNRLCNNR